MLSICKFKTVNKLAFYRLEYRISIKLMMQTNVAI